MKRNRIIALSSWCLAWIMNAISDTVLFSYDNSIFKNCDWCKLNANKDWPEWLWPVSDLWHTSKTLQFVFIWIGFMLLSIDTKEFNKWQKVLYWTLLFIATAIIIHEGLFKDLLIQ